LTISNAILANFDQHLFENANNGIYV